MATANHTTTVSRRTVLAGAAVVPLVSAPAALAAAMNEDPILPLVREYLKADAEALRLSEEVCRLEREFMAVHGRPRVPIYEQVNADTGERFAMRYAEGICEIDHLSFYTAEEKEELKARFEQARAEWWAKYESAGLGAVSRREGEAGALASDLLEKILVTPATTIAGIAAKIAVLDEWTQDECEDYVGRKLVDSLKADLARMA